MSSEKYIVLPPMDTTPQWDMHDLRAMNVFRTCPDQLIDCAYWTAVHLHDDRYGYHRTRDDIETQVYENLDDSYLVDVPVESDNYSHYECIVRQVVGATECILQQLVDLEEAHPGLELTEIEKIHATGTVAKMVIKTP